MYKLVKINLPIPGFAVVDTSKIASHGNDYSISSTGAVLQVDDNVVLWKPGCHPVIGLTYKLGNIPIIESSIKPAEGECIVYEISHDKIVIDHMNIDREDSREEYNTEEDEEDNTPESEFDEWYRESQRGFHTSQMDEKQIAHAAYSFGLRYQERELDRIIKLFTSDIERPEVKAAAIFFIKAHHDTNHKYDTVYAYAYHLRMVYETVLKYIHLVEPECVSTVLIAAWGHDSIEDARLTFNDVKKVVGEVAAMIIYACTNLRGKNRDERAPDEYYKLIINTKYASMIKLADRIANATHSKSKLDQGEEARMFYGYQKENVKFLHYFCREKYGEMIDCLAQILSTDTSIIAFRGCTENA